MHCAIHGHPTTFSDRPTLHRHRGTRSSALHRLTGPVRCSKHSSTPGSSAPLTATSPPTGSVAALVGVTFLWGTYTPALRALFSLDAAVSPQAVTACRAVISAGALLAASAVAATRNRQPTPQQLDSSQPDDAAPDAADCDSKQQLARTDEQAMPDDAPPEASSSASNAKTWGVVAAGLELGLWNFLGTSSQAIGIEFTTASKAAILTQMVAVLTPCLAWLSGQSVLPVHWACCLVALAGSCLITLDTGLDTQQEAVSSNNDGQTQQTESSAGAHASHRPVLGNQLDYSTTSSSSSNSSSSSDTIGFQVQAHQDAPYGTPVQQAWQEQPLQTPLPIQGPYAGEAFVLLGCLFYALATLRLGVHAPRHNSLQLAASKTLSQAAASVCWLLADGAAPGQVAGDAVAGVAPGAVSAAAWQLPAALSHGTGLLLLLYSALGPGALAAFLQAKGQAGVPPVQAQVVFSLTPVWAILLAAATLSDEQLSPVACLGAGIVIAASVVAAYGYKSAGSVPD